LAAVQALYQMDVAGSGLLEITAEYESFRLGKEVDGALYREADAQWFRAILAGVVENQKTVDPDHPPVADRGLAVVAPGFHAARHPARRRL
jgi:transcription termination factor NusB